MNSELGLYIGSTAMLIMAFSIVFFIYLYQRKLIKKNIENQKTRDLLQNQEMKTAYALLEGQDKERKRIAAELHDNLGSIMVTLNMYADSLLSKTDQESIQDISARISKTSNDANETIREISHSLDSGLLSHFGLSTAIEQLSEAVETAKKIKVERHLSIEEKLTNENGLEIYRIIQELVNNSLKHSRCSQIRIEINQLDNSFNLIYEDNGVGFEKEEVSEGMGLKNIKLRTEKLNGDLVVESKPDHGSTFIIDIPEL